MKTLLFCIVLVFTSSSFAQTETFKRWKVANSFAYDRPMSGTFFCNKPGILPGGCIEPAVQGDLNFTTGMVGQFAITRRLEVGTGISYSRKSEMTPYFFCGTGYGDPLYCGTSSFIYFGNTYNNFVEVPLFLRYNFLKTKLNFHVEGGTTTSMRLNEAYYGAKYRMSGQAGLGLSYTIGDLLNINATAYYERRLTNFDRLNPVFYPNSLSFELRTAIKF